MAGMDLWQIRHMLRSNWLRLRGHAEMTQTAA